MKRIKGGVNTTTQRIYDESMYFAGFLILGGILAIFLTITLKKPLFITVGVTLMGIIVIINGIIEFFIWWGKND